MLIGLCSLNDRVDCVKDFSWKLRWVNLEEIASIVFDGSLINGLVDIDERVARITPLPEVFQQNQLIEDELMLIVRDRIVEETNS